MKRISACPGPVLYLCLVPVCAALWVGCPSSATAIEPLRAEMLDAENISADNLKSLQADGTNAVVLNLQKPDRQRRAAGLIADSGMRLYYWIEVARCPELADEHPEWMASLQGHQEWRRFFPDAPEPQRQSEVIKNYPWVPVLYRESFDAQLKRVSRLLSAMPKPDGILLNDLQGAPSACGCGHPLCRWTADYGPIKTATPLEPDAAARFVKAVSERYPDSEVIPVWLTECEEHDGADDGLCAGVGCFHGICWKAWTEQLMPVAAESAHVAVLLPFRMFQRDLQLYGAPGRWAASALKTFQSMPVRHNAKPVAAEKLIAVLQGWDVTAEEVDIQKRSAIKAGTAGYIILRTEIDQSWQPRIHRFVR
ncbi:MAG: hypothetical protein RIK87_27410 [Fuerstiella sp.]